MRKRSIINWGCFIFFAALTFLIVLAAHSQEPLDPYPTIIETPAGPGSCIEIYPGYWNCI